MTTIDKASFKVTIPSIISIIGCTIAIITSFYNYRTENASKINEVKTEVQSLKNSNEIIAIQQKNGFQTINNARKRDSADTVNGLQEIKEELREMRSVLLKNTNSSYFKSPITNN